MNRSSFARRALLSLATFRAPLLVVTYRHLGRSRAQYSLQPVDVERIRVRSLSDAGARPAAARAAESMDR